MKLMKQNKKLTLLVALVSLLVLTFVLSVVAYAATPTYDLTMVFDSSMCKVYYRVNDGGRMEMESETPYPILEGSKVVIEIETKKGYTLNGEYDGKVAGVYTNSDFSGSSELKNPSDTGLSFNTFDAAKTYYVQCVNRTYTVQYVSALNNSISKLPEYEFPSDQPTQKTYGDDVAVFVPIPTLTGYTFKEWTVVQISSEDPTKYEETGYTVNDNKISDDLISEKIHATGVIYLRPVFEKNKYDVTRFDYVYLPVADGGNIYDTGLKLGQYTWTAYMDDEFYANVLSGDTELDPSYSHDSYRGYKLREGMYAQYGPGYCRVSDKASNNSLIRYYDPITYKVIFTNYYTMPDGVEVDNFTHVFNKDTALPTPSRFGYVFSGWKVTVDGTDVGTVSAEDNLLAASKVEYAAADEQITLEAIWTPEKYTIVYVDVDMAINQSLPTVHEFNTPTAITGAKRVGYQIVGWYVNGSTTMIPAENFAIAGDQATWDDPATEDVVEKVIRLQAVWEPKELTVVFDGNGAGDTVYGVGVLYNEQGIPKDKIIFDTLLGGVYTKIPSRTGYTFIGYFSEPGGGVQYFDAEGKALDGAKWITDSLDDGNVIKLYAHWQVNTYDLFLNIDKSLITSLTINGVEYLKDEDGDGEWDNIGAISVDYRQKLTIVITSKDGYKVVKFKNQTVEHQSVFTNEYQHLTDGDLTVEIILLETQKPDVKVDYTNETLTNHGALFNGAYTIYVDGLAWFSGTAENGKFQIGDLVYTTLPSDFYGKTIQVVWHGDGVATADSDPVDVVIAARPVLSPDQWFEVHEKDGNIEVSIPESAIGKYEFSISKNNVLADNAVWQSSNVFATLANGEQFTPGTTYYVFVRIKATDSVPHSTPNGPWTVTTYHHDFIAALKGELNGARQDGDGAYVQTVIDNAKAALDALAGETPLSPTFYEDALSIVANAKNELTLARKRDRAAAKLNEKVNALLETGAYNVNGEIQLDLILDKAVLDLETAENEEEINRILNKALSDIAAVKVSSVTATDTSSNSNLQIIAPGGMSADAKVALVRIADLKLLSSKVSEAIRAGKIIVTQNGVSYDDMLDVLGTQEVVAAFKVIVSNDTADSGMYEIRLLIPDDLRSIQSLHVGYYDDVTGELKLFETHIDGDYLVFTADKIADFVIIGDPNVSLIPIIAILGGTLLLQLIAIIYLLIRRKKVAKTVRLYSAALPVMALTIRFLPVYGLPIVVLLGGLVVIAQIVLIVLLLKSDIIHRRPNDTVDAPVSMPEESAPAVIPQIATEDLPSEAYADDEAVEEVFHAPYEDEPIADEAELPQTEEEDPFAIYDEDPTEDAQDFIEPAVTPRYSLPDEEDSAPAFAKEEDTPTYETDDEDAIYEENAEEVYEEVDWEEVDENTPIEDTESEELYYELGDEEELAYEDAPAEVTDEPQLYTLSFEADDAYAESDENGEMLEEDVVYEASEGDEETVEAEEVLEYEEDPFADIDDSRLAQDEVYSEDEVEDIDDSKERYEE